MKFQVLVTVEYESDFINAEDVKGGITIALNNQLKAAKSIKVQTVSDYENE